MERFRLKQMGVIVFGGGLNKPNAIREAEAQGYFVIVPFGGNHAELYVERIVEVKA